MSFCVCPGCGGVGTSGICPLRCTCHPACHCFRGRMSCYPCRSVASHASCAGGVSTGFSPCGSGCGGCSPCCGNAKLRLRCASYSREYEYPSWSVGMNCGCGRCSY